MPETIDIIFIGYANEAKSPMAEAIARHLAGPRVRIESGGIFPSRTVAAEAIQALAERGIAPASRVPRPVDEAFAADAHHVIALTDAMPKRAYGRRLHAWVIDTPTLGDVATYRAACAQLERRVRELLASEGALRAEEVAS